jgi:ATP-dependent helicase/DNAse subunit B
MLSLGHDVVNDVVAEGACPGTTAEKRLAVWRVGQLVETVLVMEAEWQNSLLTVETEVAVGAETGVDIGGLKVLGRVDRLDEDSASRGLFVVDYKSGKVPSAKKIGTSEGLQLPLYLLALAAERPERPLIGAAYVSPREQKRTGVLLNSDRWRPPCPADTASGGSDASSLLGASRTQDGPVRNAAPGGLLALSEDETDQLFATAKAVATRAAQAMRSGDIAPLSGRECPSWCDLRSACRAYRGRTDR